MFRANIKFRDGSCLNDIHLYKSRELWTTIIIDKCEVPIVLHPWGDTIHFGNGGIQGHFIPAHVESYELNDLSEEELNEYINLKLLKEISDLKRENTYGETKVLRN